jgi:hypothetical protein
MLAVRDRAIDGTGLSPTSRKLHPTSSPPGLAGPAAHETSALPAATGTFTSGLQAGRSPFPPPDITKATTGLLCWRDLHPLERQLASLHQHSLPGARYRLPGPVSHPRDHASLTWRTSNPAFFGLRIASQSLSSGARSRDPLARNDSNFGNTAQTFGAIAFATISPALAAIASRPHPRTRRRPRPPSSSA